MPAKYPNWTFITNEFRYSARLPETFADSIDAYSASVNRLFLEGESIEERLELMSINVWVARGKAQLHALREPFLKLTELQLTTGNWGYLVNKGVFYDLEPVRSTSDSFTPLCVYTDQFSTAFNLTGQSVAVSPVTPTKAKKTPKAAPK